jgi:hypothetical protein
MSDTSAAAELVQLELLRNMSPHERLTMALSLSRQVKRMCMAAIRRRHPEFDDNAVRLKFIELTYGEELADNIRRWQKDQAVG